MSFLPIHSFDWEYYITTNAIQHCTNFVEALSHFAETGMKLGLKTAPPHKNTNFDFQYYITHNKLENIHTEKEAYNHYQKFGKKQGLPFCRQFTIVITLHLYHAEIMKELINAINNFIKNNPSNDYHVKITIPIDESFLDKQAYCDQQQSVDEKTAITFFNNHIARLGSIPKNYKNNPTIAHIAYKLTKQIESMFIIKPNRIQTIYMENKGADIGGLCVVADEIKNDELKTDFLVKLHTKRGYSHNLFDIVWRHCLLSILNIRINTILTEYDCIYTCRLNSEKDPWLNKNKQQELYKKLKFIGNKNYDFCGGTMFIVSSKFLDAIQELNLQTIYSMLTYERKTDSIEEVFERMFGDIFCSLKLKTLHIGYIPANFPESLPL